MMNWIGVSQLTSEVVLGRYHPRSIERDEYDDPEYQLVYHQVGWA